MDIFEKIVRIIARNVENMRGEECALCQATYKNYNGHCKAYTWSMTCSANGIWQFRLYCHEREIWYCHVLQGDISDLLLKVLKELPASGPQIAH